MLVALAMKNYRFTTFGGVKLPNSNETAHETARRELVEEVGKLAADYLMAHSTPIHHYVTGNNANLFHREMLESFSSEALLSRLSLSEHYYVAWAPRTRRFLSFMSDERDDMCVFSHLDELIDQDEGVFYMLDGRKDGCVCSATPTMACAVCSGRFYDFLYVPFDTIYRITLQGISATQGVYTTPPMCTFTGARTALVQLIRLRKSCLDSFCGDYIALKIVQGSMDHIDTITGDPFPSPVKHVKYSYYWTSVSGLLDPAPPSRVDFPKLFIPTSDGPRVKRAIYHHARELLPEASVNYQVVAMPSSSTGRLERPRHRVSARESARRRREIDNSQILMNTIFRLINADDVQRFRMVHNMSSADLVNVLHFIESSVLPKDDDMRRCTLDSLIPLLVSNPTPDDSSPHLGDYISMIKRELEVRQEMEDMSKSPHLRSVRTPSPLKENCIDTDSDDDGEWGSIYNDIMRSDDPSQDPLLEEMAEEFLANQTDSDSDDDSEMPSIHKDDVYYSENSVIDEFGDRYSPATDWTDAYLGNGQESPSDSFGSIDYPDYPDDLGDESLLF
jgi:hypothetical protein